MKKYLYTLIAFLSIGMSAKAQTGELQGKVTDEKGDAVPFANIVVVTDRAGTQATSKGAKADVNGFYTMKGLNPGTYNFRASSLGKKVVETDISIRAGYPTTLNFKFESQSNKIKQIVVGGKATKKAKLIDVFTPKENVIGATEIKNSANRDVNSLAATTGGVVQEDFGASLNIGGGRDNGTVVFVDGVKMTGSSSVPPSSIAQLEVFTSGLPAKYGDANAGVINIVTKGPADKFRGGLEGITSQMLDPFGYNLIGGNISGPIFRRKATYDSTNPAKIEKIKGEPSLGYAISGEYQSDLDRSPSILGSWKVKDAKYDEILNSPYLLANDGVTMLQRASQLNINDLERIAYHQNTSGCIIRLNGKLDWKVVPNKTNITLGARFTNDNYNDFINRYSLLNYQNNKVFDKYSYNGYVRLYQPLYDDKKQEKKLFKNTVLQLQADYTNSGENSYSPVGKYDHWNYGYIGKFEETYSDNYTRVKTEQTDPPKVYYAPGKFLEFADHWMSNSPVAKSVTYTPGNINPLGASFTEKFINTYRAAGLDIASISRLSTIGGIINGNRSNELIHDLFYPSARIFNGMQKEDNKQMRLTGSLNFDIIKEKSKGNLNKHTLEVGFEIEQRINSKYTMSPNTLWTDGQTDLNSHLTSDNTKNYNPLLIMDYGKVRMRLQDYINQLDSPNAVVFAAFDSIKYDRQVSNGGQTNFSKNLREAFGFDSTSFVNIHALDPSKMNINFYSFDELLRNNKINGAAIGGTSSLYGYDAYGNILSNTVTFNDFFTAKDNKGNFLRNIAANMPRYGAAYITDRFQLNEVAFNVGVRLDYFDPNCKQFIDPYSPQLARTISDDKIFSHPSTVPKDAVIYVDNSNDPSKVNGYRSGSQWYDRKGNALSGPDLIKLESQGTLNPYLKGNTDAERDQYDMSKSTFNPDLMFSNAPAKFAISPRMNFTFKIDSNSLLFAHYDVLAQRPEQTYNLTTAFDYYNLLLNSGTVIANPNLDFARTTDLELGFKQRLNSRSSLTINFQYRDFQNQIGITRINGAYGFPSLGYTTYYNGEFSTYKGIGLAYEMRRTNNLAIKANYTMSFSDGTSASATSQQNLIASGQGNLKVLFPMPSDVRHIMNLNLNYRFDEGVNFLGPKTLQKFLENSGINFDFSLRSGKPYTLQGNPTSEMLINNAMRSSSIGDLNAGSMPWRFVASMKIDKDFQFKFGSRAKDSAKNAGLDTRKEYSFNIFLQIRNLLNSYQVLNVSRFTGSPETDGYLASPLGQADYIQKEIQRAGNGQAFRDLYKVATEFTNSDDRISNYAMPRTIQLGATLSF